MSYEEMAKRPKKVKKPRRKIRDSVIYLHKKAKEKKSKKAKKGKD
jgi:hypothetical protein